MSTINYSKWDHIEGPGHSYDDLVVRQKNLIISDDEDDVHPNIDTPSLFRWRHQARMDRMEEEKKEKEKLAKEQQDNQQKRQMIKQKLKETEDQSPLDSVTKMKVELETLEKQEEEYKKKEEELQKKERLTPWNIDTICHEGKSKTIINKFEPKKELTEDEKADRQVKFTKEHKSEVKKFGMIRKYDDSADYLSEHLHLACEETANFLVLWCIDLEIEEKHDLMAHVAHQTIVMQFILELAKQMDLDPKQCVRPFFSKIKLGQKEYMDAFNEELNAFKSRIQARAKQKIEEAIKEHEEISPYSVKFEKWEERQKRLGPGGLDPVEVFETLPQTLKDCFESKDVGLLQKVILELPREDAEYHMKRCVDSGLWVPNAGDSVGIQEEEGARGIQEEGGARGVQEEGCKPQEEVYEDVD